MLLILWRQWMEGFITPRVSMSHNDNKYWDSPWMLSQRILWWCLVPPFPRLFYLSIASALIHACAHMHSHLLKSALFISICTCPWYLVHLCLCCSPWMLSQGSNAWRHPSQGLFHLFYSQRLCLHMHTHTVIHSVHWHLKIHLWVCAQVDLPSIMCSHL